MTQVSKPLVLHVISNLEIGGAEKVLAGVATGAGDFRHHVVSLGSSGPIGQKLEAQHVKVTALGMPRGTVSVRAIVRLWLTVRRLKPNLIQTWMYHSDFLGGLAAKLAGVPVIWNLRKSSLDFSSIKKSTLAIMFACGALSWLIPNQIIVCSSSSPANHRRFGYRTSAMTFVPNGVDLDRFRSSFADPGPERINLGLSPKKFTIGMFVRFHPQKDIFGFLEAVRKLLKDSDDFQVVLAGRGMNEENPCLVEAIRQRQLANAVVLAGFIDEPASALNALDLLVLSSSSGEGFPNILAEAMASGIPCVATDTGESRQIVANTGWIVEPQNPVKLAQALSNAMNCPNDEMKARGERARLRIEQEFSTQQMINRYQRIYADTISLK